ncbi:MAG: PilZ domain-containing protein [Gemmataceae bacterium]
MFKWWGRRETKPTPPLVERRGAERHALGLKVNDKLTVSVGTASWPAVVYDLSTTGIGLIMGVRPDASSAFDIKLHCVTKGVAYTLHAQVVRTILLPDGNWFCGCALTENLPEEDIKKIL